MTNPNEDEGVDAERGAGVGVLGLRKQKATMLLLFQINCGGLFDLVSLVLKVLLSDPG